jgi:hypothetical protein
MIITYMEFPNDMQSKIFIDTSVVMQNHQVTQALTTDTHYQQAGFQALLLE